MNLSKRASWNPIPLIIRRVLLLFVFITTSWVVIEAQETEPSKNLTSPDVSNTEENPEKEDAEKSPDSEEPPEISKSKTEILREDSLLLDISSSSRDELIAWCTVLNLPSDGDDENLKQRLISYYGLFDVFQPTLEKSEGTRIVVESARKSELFDVKIESKEESESIVRLTGGVLINVEEPESGRRHKLSADSVVFNQDDDTISAVGNIRYIVNTNGREEKFSGDSLVFKITDWTGVIFRGTSERNQLVDGKNVDFFFRGDSIKRSGKDILVLDKGVISSHDSDNPDYSLKAEKIWITGPGEWGVFSATLYTGHVPVFYIPFYWKSGSDMLFNPVIGQRTRVGYLIQTTTYFLGRKKQDERFSIMGFGDSAGSGHKYEREGLFLIRRPYSKGEEVEENRNTLKYMLDVYTSLGASTAIFGNFPKIGTYGSSKFYVGIGVSRSVTDNGQPFFLDPLKRKTVSYWNQSYLGKLILPFRWGSYVDFSLKGWAFHFDWYSDPYYNTDFGTRKENFDWMNFLLSEEGTTISNAGFVSSLKWEAKTKGSLSLPLKNVQPWISSIALQRFKVALNWGTKSNQALLTTRPDYKYNPARDFFYPKELTLPDFAFSFRGAMPTLTLTQADINKKKKSLEPVVPVPSLPEDSSGEPTAELEPKPNPNSIQFYESIGGTSYSGDILRATLNYNAKSDASIKYTMDYSNWDKPSDIDFTLNPGKLKSINTAELNYGLGVANGILSMNGKTKYTGYYQTSVDMFRSKIGVTDGIKLSNYQYSKMLMDSQIAVAMYPFKEVKTLSNSRISYDISARLFYNQFKSAKDIDNPIYKTFLFSGKDDIRTHKTAAVFTWNPGPLQISVSGTSNLPPRTLFFVLNGNMSLAFLGFKFSAGQRVEYKEEKWTIPPLSMSISWKGWDDHVQFSQTASLDTEKGRFNNIRANLNFWGLATSFQATYGKNYTWDALNYRWRASDNESFAVDSFTLSYNRTFNIKPFWKNRIKLFTTMGTSWNYNIRRPTNNTLTFSLAQGINIHKFLNLAFSISASNRSMYLYFPHLRNQLGIEGEYSFFEDLLKSFNFFKESDRLESQFKMGTLSLSLNYQMRNWNLSVAYSGFPTLDSQSNSYKWKPEFNLYVKWVPLPMFNQRTKFSDKDWTVDFFKQD